MTSKRFHALTRGVSPAFAECELTHIDRLPLDLPKAVSQHGAYERLLEELGASVERIAADPVLPDCVFIEDTAVVTPHFTVMARPGAASRRGEVDAVAAALGRHRPLDWIRDPGTLDGGDVLVLDRVLYVGVGLRTNRDGVSQLASLAARHGYRVESIPISRCLHLKTAVTRVAGDTLLLNPEWVEGGRFPGYRILSVAPEEPFAANCLRLGETLVYGAGYPRTAERLVKSGMDVRTVDVSELGKAEGGVTCCSLILER